MPPPHLWVTSACCMTASPPPPPPPSLVPPFSISFNTPRHLLLFVLPPTTRLELHTPTLFLLQARTTPLFVPSLHSVPLLSLSFPPSCEIAVVSYGFLFLRDGRWAHVGVEATKHAASCIHA